MKKAIGLVVTAVLLVSAACSSDSSSTRPAASTQLNVFAAASLTNAFTKLGSDFETASPGTKVTFNFGSSTDLATQIGSEGTADVFASASGTAMDTVESAPGVSDRTNFATNSLVIITPPDDPGSIDDIQDLANPGVKLATPLKACRWAPASPQKTGTFNAADVVSNEGRRCRDRREGGLGDADAAYRVPDIAGRREPGPVGRRTPSGIATYPIAVVTGAA
jgi:molybdate transport system substrate-binding protein